MVFQLIVAVAVEVAVFTYSMVSEVKSAWGGRTENLENLVSARNEANKEGIKQAHIEYEQVAKDQQRANQQAAGPVMISSSVSLSSVCVCVVMMMMMAATAA